MNKVNVRAYCIRPIFTAIIALAIAFTFSACSSGDDSGGGDGDSSSSGEVGLPSSSGGSSSSAAGGTSSSSSSLSSSSSSSSEGASSPSGTDNGDGSAITNNQAHVEVSGDTYVFTKFDGSGNIKIEVGCDGVWGCDYINGGKIEDGIVKLQLPSSVDVEYLTSMDAAFGWLDGFPSSCNIPASLKVTLGEFHFELLSGSIPSTSYCNDGGYLDYSYYEGDKYNNLKSEFVLYLYSSEAAKIKCEDKDATIDLNLAKGWNETYGTEFGEKPIKFGTNKSILKHQSEMKWGFRC